MAFGSALALATRSAADFTGDDVQQTARHAASRCLQQADEACEITLRERIEGVAEACHELAEHAAKRARVTRRDSDRRRGWRFRRACRAVEFDRCDIDELAAGTQEVRLLATARCCLGRVVMRIVARARRCVDDRRDIREVTGTL